MSKPDTKAYLYFSAVMHMLFSIMGSGVAGYFLEKWLKAKGLAMIFMILTGVVVGLILLYKKITVIDKL